MGTYYTTKCGHCNVKWENFVSRRSSSFGPPNIKCRICGGMNVTAMDLYRDFNLFQKVFYWAGNIIQDLLFLFFGLILLVGGIWSINDSFSAVKLIPILIGLYFIVRVVMTFFAYSKNRKYIEETYDSNGGFLWSDEQF